jgi:hypothetical protein
MVALRVSSLLPCAAPQAPRRPARRSLQGGRRRAGPVAAHTVTVEHKGKTHKLSIEGDATILEAALDAGIELPHDCKARAALRICDTLRVYALSPQARCCDVMLLCVQSYSALRKALPWSGRCWAATEVWRLSGLTPDASTFWREQMGVCMTCPAKLIRCVPVAVLKNKHGTLRCSRGASFRSLCAVLCSL